MNKRLWGLMLAVVLALAGAGVAWSQSQPGTLEITGVPTDVVAGRYDREAKTFFADVREISSALITVKLDDVQIVGKTMEGRTDDEYLLLTVDVYLKRDDFELTGDVVEYFGTEKRLKAQGNVVVQTEDATVYADDLDYNEESDEALFTGNVKVVFTDGVLEGQRFLMLMEKSELQFFGSFQGEFNDEGSDEQ